MKSEAEYLKDKKEAEYRKSLVDLQRRFEMATSALERILVEKHASNDESLSTVILSMKSMPNYHGISRLESDDEKYELVKWFTEKSILLSMVS